jgi:RNA polymerase sigma-70 factor, ECF subfamily
VVLSEIDRKLLQRCLNRKPHAWEDFVDRFVGLVVHVIRHTAKSRAFRLTPQDEEDLAAEFFMAMIRDDYAVLRRFRGESSLATYLTVVARRVVVRELLKDQARSRLTATPNLADLPREDDYRHPEGRIEDRDEVERLLRGLGGFEAEVVRLYHLEGKSYREISSTIGIPENSVGPTLSRARARLRQTVGEVPSR